MQISVATYVSDRPIFMQNAQRPKGVPLGLLFGPLCCGIALYFSHTPTIQDGTGHWDGVRLGRTHSKTLLTGAG